MKITLDNNGIGYFEGGVFTICDEPLEIPIEAKSALDNLYAICVLNKDRMVYKVKNGMLSIPPEFLSPGALQINVQQIENGKTLENWSVEKITLRNIRNKYEIIPEIDMIRKELNVIKQALAELVRIVKKNSQI